MLPSISRPPGIPAALTVCMRFALAISLSACGGGAEPPPTIRVFPDAARPITPLDVAEDADGDLWIAAEQGVFRFNGLHYDHIAGAFHNPSSISVVGGSTVLVGAENGLFQYRNGSTLRLTPEPTYGFDKLADNLVLFEHRYGDGVERDRWIEAGIWDGSRVGLYPQYPRPDQLPWKASDGSLWSLRGNSPCSMQNIAELRNALRNGAFHQYALTRCVVLKSLTIDPAPLEFLPGSNGWYFGQRDNTISVMRPGKATRQFYTGGFVIHKRPPPMYADHEGRVWMLEDDLWVGADGTLRKFKAPSLEGRQVTCVFEDSRRRIWFGLKQGGLAVLGSDPMVESWTAPAAFGEINALTRQNPTTLFAATIKGALFRKKGDGEWITLSRGEQTMPISQVAAAESGTLLGLIRFGPPVQLSAEGRISRQMELPTGTVEAQIRRLVSAPDGTFLLGTQQQEGLYRITGDRVEIVQLPVGHNGHVQDIGFDAGGQTFVAYEGGVCRAEGLVCHPVISMSDGLLSPKLRGIGIGPPGEIWIAYRELKAFSRLRFSDNRWTARHFTESGGFADPETMFLRRDRRGWVWRGSENGLWVSDGVHVEPEDWIQISEKDGLPSQNINRFGFLEDADGSVWIGTAKGIAHIKPSESWFTVKRPVRISNITYGQRSFAGRALLPAGFESAEQFMTRFAGSDLLPVRYRLLPKHTNWQVSRTGEVGFGKLDAGRYRLEATSGRGNAVAEYAFEVTDPARNRRRAAAFTALSALAVLLGLAVVLRWRGKRFQTTPDEFQRFKQQFLAARGGAANVSDKRLARLIRLYDRNSDLPSLWPSRRVLLNGIIDDPLLGIVIRERYRIDEVIAHGNYASVYLARDLQRNLGLCAVKIFHLAREERKWMLRRSEQEIEALKRIHHPNVVAFLDAGEMICHVPFLAMEYLPGVTLRSVLTEGPLERTRVGRFTAQLGDALGAIHERGIFHRDLKPENLMVLDAGCPGERIVIIDFSIAIVRDPQGTLHGRSRAAGSLLYMAPEQSFGYASPATDIYTLALVVFEMLTGKNIGELGLVGTVANLPMEFERVLARIRPYLAADVMHSLAAAVSFELDKRPQNARDFAYDLASGLCPS